MIDTVSAGDSGVEEYLANEFGSYQKCCDVIMPPVGAIILIANPLKTAHISSGTGLDENQCIPAGVYKVGDMQLGCASHTAVFEVVSDHRGEGKVFFFAGYRHGEMVDWRGVKKVKT